MPDQQTIEITTVIHEWLKTVLSTESDLYLSADYAYSSSVIPNIRFMYKDDYVKVLCWLPGQGAAPDVHIGEYADPKFFAKLEHKLKEWKELEKHRLTIACVRNDR